jgi:isoleucyl-tRNA synthetase
LYANLDNFSYEETAIVLEERPEIDRWILSELNTLVKNVDAFYEAYEPTKAARAIQDFVSENLSNWFVRLSRRRFWKGDYKQDKISAYQSLYTCLLTVAKLSAPIAPFFMDNLYKDLTNAVKGNHAESVHLVDFPTCNEDFIDTSLERKMQKAQQISSMVLSLRKKEMIKVRQPLQRVMIPVLDQKEREDITAIQDLIISEVNVKEIELIDDASGILVKNIKPNFKVLGPKYGKEMRFVGAAVQQFGQEEIQTLEKDGKIAVEINGNFVDLNIEEVEITSQDIEGWLVTNQGGLTVALDVHITEALRKEGIARELINRIQNIRKETGLEVTDTIHLSLEEDAALKEAVLENESYIKSETLTNTLEFSAALEEGVVVEFDAIKTKLLICKS